MSLGDEKISLQAATVIAINAMIGVGVLAMPAVLSRNVGPASIFSFLISIFAVVCIGLTLARAAHHYPGEGWNYLYPSKWAGHYVGLLSAGAYLVAVTIAMGFLVQQAGVWTHKLLPFFSPTTLSIGIQVTLTALVLAGTTISSVGQYIIAGFVVSPLAITALMCWMNFNPTFLTPFMPGGWTSVFAALPQALFGLFGFESVASLYSQVENPQRNVPRAFLTAIVIVGSLYLAFVSGTIFSIPAAHFSGGLNDTLSNVLLRVFPDQRFLATFVLVGATFGIIGTLHSMIWSVSALLTDVLRKVKLHSVKNALRKGIWTPTLSILLTAGSMLAISLCAPPGWLIALTSLFMLPSFILSSAAMLFLRKEWQSGFNFITLCGLGAGSLVFYYALQRVLVTF